MKIQDLIKIGLVVVLIVSVVASGSFAQSGIVAKETSYKAETTKLQSAKTSVKMEAEVTSKKAALAGSYAVRQDGLHRPDFSYRPSIIRPVRPLRKKIEHETKR